MMQRAVAVVAGLGIAAFLVLAGARWFIRASPDDQVTSEVATDVAEACFAYSKVIPANTTVTILPISPAAKDLPPLKLRPNADLEPGAGSDEAKGLLVLSAGSFEFQYPTSAQKPLLVEADGVQFYWPREGVARRGAARFGPVERASYSVKAEWTRQGAKAQLKNSDNANLDIEAGQRLVTLQPLSVKQWIGGVRPTLFLAQGHGTNSLSELIAAMTRPGVRFDQQGLVIDGCARWTSNGQPVTRPVAVTNIKAAQVGAGTARLIVPVDAWPNLPRAVTWAEWAVPKVELYLASHDGGYQTYGAFRTISQALAFVGASLVVGGGLWWLTSLRHSDLKKGALPRGSDPYFSSLFLGNDGQPSLSLFQIFFWTTIATWAILYVYIVTGDLLQMTTSMMALLGIAGVGTVVARFVAQDDGRPTDALQPYRFWEILSTNGRFDLLKLQLFVFTIVIGVYVTWRILYAGAFPELDTNTLLLLGVSQGVYVGGKLGASTALSRAQTLKVQIDTHNATVNNVTKEIERGNARLADTVSPPDPNEKAKLESAIKANETKLAELKAAIARDQADLTKVLSELGLRPA